MSNVDDAQRIVKRLVRGTDLAAWEITVEINDKPGKDSAEIEFDDDYPTYAATIHVHSDWANRAFSTLEQIVGHELGHLIVNHGTRWLNKSEQRDTLEEYLASRVGKLLIDKSKAR